MNTYSDVSDQNSIGGNSDLASGDIDLLNAQTTRKSYLQCFCYRVSDINKDI